MLKVFGRITVLFSLFFGFHAIAADHGLFMVVKGSVKVISASDKKQTVAKVGSKVFSGDTVITEKDSRAKIVMSDRNVLQLSPDSTFEITKYKTGATEKDREVQVALMQGKVRVEVEQKYGEKNKFELRTPTAVAGVRGTKYVAEYNKVTASTIITVIAGSVAVNSIRLPNAAPVILSPGMATSVKDSGAGQPYQAPAQDLDSGDVGTSSSGQGSMVTSDMVGEESIKKPENAPPPPTASAPVQNQGPTIPKVPTTVKPPDIVKDAVQSGNSKAKVIITPKPQ